MAVHAESSIQLNTIPIYTSLLGGHFIYRANGTTDTPASANIIQIASTPSNPSTWGFNTHIGSNGIKLRYNEIDLSEWSSGGLKLYYSTTNGGIISGSQLGVHLTANTLTFYNSGIQNKKGLELDATTVKFYGSNQLDPDAILSSTGLKLVKGGLEAGTPGQDFVYISSEDYQLKDATHNGITINGHTPTAAGTDGKTVDDPGWREVIGTKFGVDSEGRLWANEAHIVGSIDATTFQARDSNNNIRAIVDNNGLTIKDTSNNTVASFYEAGITLSSSTTQRIGGINNYISFIPSQGENAETIAFVGSNIIFGDNIGFDALATKDDLSTTTSNIVEGTSYWQYTTNNITYDVSYNADNQIEPYYYITYDNENNPIINTISYNDLDKVDNEPVIVIRGGLNQTNETLTILQNQTNDLQDTVSTNASAITSLETGQTSINSQITTINNTTANLTTDMDKMTGAVRITTSPPTVTVTTTQQDSWVRITPTQVMIKSASSSAAWIDSQSFTAYRGIFNEIYPSQIDNNGAVVEGSSNLVFLARADGHVSLKRLIQS